MNIESQNQDSTEETILAEPNMSAELPLVDKTEMTESFLKAEIENNRNLAKKTWQWGSVAVLVLAVYFTALISSVRSVVFDSDGIAAIISTELDKKIPEQLGVLENVLIAQAPLNAINAVQALQSYIPQARARAENTIDHIVYSLPVMNEEISTSIKAYIEQNREAIVGYAKTHNEQEFATYFMSGLLTSVLPEVEGKIKPSSAGLNNVKSLSLSRLVALNAYLERLGNTNRYDLTEREQLERRAIVTWVKLLEVED